jgi:hypothetical protein
VQSPSQVLARAEVPLRESHVREHLLERCERKFNA